MLSLLQTSPAYTGTVHLHNFLRWIILVTLIWSLINAFKGKNGKETLIMMISSHVMLLLGLVQWFWGQYGMKAFQGGMKEVMGQKVARFYSVEHPLMMIIAIVLITIGHRKAKNTEVNTTTSNGVGAKWFFLAALIIILVMIPWPGRDLIGRGMFPGMH